MADLGTLMMKVSADTNGFEKSMVGATGHISKVAGVAILAGAAIAGAFAVTAVNAASNFEQQMASVSTLLSGDVNKRITELGDNVKRLAITTGTSTELLTDGLYQVVSAFGDTADSMNILEIASKGAKAGNSTVTDSVNLLSAVTKGYGDTSSEAAKKASDLAFQTVKLGQTTFPELAASMGKVIPLAAAMKVSQEELFGAMATLTGVTGGTAEVTTQLRGIVQGLLKPTAEMAAVIEQVGYSSGQAMIESLGLQGTLDLMKESVGGNETEFANLFGSVEAVGAALALTGSQSENFTMKTQAMRDAAGATDEAFKKMSETFQGTKDRIQQSTNVMMISIGDKLLPKMQELASWLEGNMPAITNAFEGIFSPKTTIVILAMAGAIVGALIPALVGIATAAAAALIALAPFVALGMGVALMIGAVSKAAKENNIVLQQQTKYYDDTAKRMQESGYVTKNVIDKETKALDSKYAAMNKQGGAQLAMIEKNKALALTTSAVTDSIAGATSGISSSIPAISGATAAVVQQLTELEKLSLAMEIMQAKYNLWMEVNDDTATSAEKLRAKLQLQADQVVVLTDKIQILEYQYKNSVIAKGENADATQKLILELTKEKEAQEKLKNSIEDTNTSLLAQAQIQSRTFESPKGNTQSYYDPTTGYSWSTRDGVTTVIDDKGNRTVEGADKKEPSTNNTTTNIINVKSPSEILKEVTVANRKMAVYA